MNIYAWISVVGIIVFALLPLCKKSTRTRETMIHSILTIVVVIIMIVAVSVFHVPLLFAIIGMLLVLFFINPKWYTPKGLTIIGGIILSIGLAAYFYVFKPNPEYVLKYLENNPDSSSFVLMENGESIVSYQADQRMPLASTVKIVIAIEYAKQAAAGKINPQEKIPLKEPGRYYLKNTDGGAHPAWLKEMEDKNLISDDEVALHDIAKGMIHYSSNANTDYLFSVLGIDRVNELIEKLGLDRHEPVYPIVGAMLIPNQMQNENMDEKELKALLRNLTDEEYREKAMQIHKAIQAGKLQLRDINYDAPLSIQKIWSDRLPGATAHDYQKLMATINGKSAFSGEELEYLRDLMEWPMDVPGNEERFVHFGAKGGSTAFVLNQAIYVEDHEGNQIELVMFTDDLSRWQHFKLGRSYNEFVKKVLGQPKYRTKIGRCLSSEDVKNNISL